MPPRHLQLQELQIQEFQLRELQLRELQLRELRLRVLQFRIPRLRARPLPPMDRAQQEEPRPQRLPQEMHPLTALPRKLSCAREGPPIQPCNWREARAPIRHRATPPIKCWRPPNRISRS